MALKDWILIVGVASLVLERIVRWIFKAIRPEKEIDNLAMDMVKIHEKRSWDSSPLSFFNFYKEGLKAKGKNYRRGFIDYIIAKEKKVNQNIEHFHVRVNNTFATIEQLEDVLFYMEELDKQGKLPDDLKTFFQEAQSLVWRSKDARKYRGQEIKDIIDKTFKRTATIFKKTKTETQGKGEQDK